MISCVFLDTRALTGGLSCPRFSACQPAKSQRSRASTRSETANWSPSSKGRIEEAVIKHANRNALPLATLRDTSLFPIDKDRRPADRIEEVCGPGGGCVARRESKHCALLCL